MKSLPKTPFFLPYQQRWIQDSSQIKIMEKSRQIGMSWTAAYTLVRRQATSLNNLDTWVSSRDITQAKLFLQDCKTFAQILNLASSSLGTPLLNQKKSSSFSLHFHNNTCIHSLSSNPNAQAGKRGTRLLDEFALHPNPQYLYSIASPGITWGGQLEIISTHRGTHNFFNHLIQESSSSPNPKSISHHRVTLQDALEQGFLLKLKQKLPKNDPRQFMDNAAYFDFVRNSCSDHESFMQEYMCTPSDESSFFLHPSLIQSAEYPENSSWELPLPLAHRSPNDLFLGVDLGRTNDLTVFWLLENINSTLFTRQLICLKNTPFHIQEKILNDWLSLPNLRSAAIDQSGIGRQFTENAYRSFGNRILPISFSNSTKEYLAYSLKSHLEKNLLRIPPDNLVRADLRAIKRSSSLSGNIQFSANRNYHGHSDRFWALALAIHAAQNRSPIPIHYSPISQSNLWRKKS